MGNKIKTHFKENNEDSERHLHENELKFSNQCKKVLSLLRQGVVLTTRSAMIDYDIGDVHRRIGELRDENKIEGIVDEWIKDDDGKTTKCKMWYMPEFAKSKTVNKKPPGVKAPIEAKELKPKKQKPVAQHNPLFD